MAAVMDESLAPVTRRDFDELATVLREEVASALAVAASPPGHDALSDVLGQLRMLKWSLGFALVAIMGGFGVLYQGLIDLRAEMHAGFAQVRGEFAQVRGEIAELRREVADVRGELGDARGDTASLAERVARLEVGQAFILRRLEELFPGRPPRQPDHPEGASVDVPSASRSVDSPRGRQTVERHAGN